MNTVWMQMRMYVLLVALSLRDFLFSQHKKTEEEYRAVQHMHRRSNGQEIHDKEKPKEYDMGGAIVDFYINI